MNWNMRKKVAEETLAVIERGTYEVNGCTIDLTNDIQASVEGSRLFTPDQLSDLAREDVEGSLFETIITVSNETTLNAASRLAKKFGDDLVLALNFASGKHPGGGFLRGSEAQEESIARASALYPTLNAHFEYYEVNRAYPTEFYTDHMIYSPAVPVFRDDSADFLNEPYNLSILTAPGVKAGEVRKHQPELVSEITGTMRRRIGYVLHIALQLGYKDLVLGAWGCGVFRNDPNEIAGHFADYLLPGGLFAGQFRRIDFAVLDRQGHGQIIGPFEAAFDPIRLKG